MKFSQITKNKILYLNFATLLYYKTIQWQRAHLKSLQWLQISPQFVWRAKEHKGIVDFLLLKITRET